MKTKIVALSLLLMAATTQAQIDRPMPTPGPAPTVNLGKSHEFKLSNGLTVIVVENHKLPRVSATLSIDNPPAALGEKMGVEGLLSQMLGTGTQALSKEEFNQRIEQLGARVGYSSSGASASSLTKYFDEIFGYFAQGVKSPKFTEAEFKAVKDRYIEGIKSDEKNVESAARRMSRVLTYGASHPFGEFETKEQIEKLTLADVQNFYQTSYLPNNSYLVFVGDINKAQAQKLAEKHLADWKKGTISAKPLPNAPLAKTTTIEVVDMPNAVQSVVSVSYPITLTKKDPDYYAAQVASTILGGDFGSRLNMNLREKHGWTYGARGGVSDSRYVGRFFTNATVRNSVTDSAVVETIKEMQAMTQTPVSAKELADVKALYLGNFVLSLERPETIARQALTTKTDGLSSTFYKDYLQNINKVTAADVQRVATKYFRPTQARVVVTGKAEEIGPALKKLGYPVTFYDQYGNKIEDPSTRKTAVAISTEQLIENNLKAQGGDKLKALNSLTQEGKIKMMGMEGEYKASYMMPDKSLATIKIMGMEIKTVFDGEKGYVSQMGQEMKYDANTVKQLQGYNSVFPALSKGFASAKILDVVKEGDNSYYKVKMEGSNRTEYYDTKTFLLAKTEMVTSTPMGDMLSTMHYKDYKSFEGVMLPTVVDTQAGPQSFTITLNAMKTGGVNASDFK